MSIAFRIASRVLTLAGPISRAVSPSGPGGRKITFKEAEKLALAIHEVVFDVLEPFLEKDAT